MRGQAQVWKAKSALTARPAAPLTRRPPPPWQSARRPRPRKLFSAAPPRSAPVPRAAGIVTEVPGAPRGERPVAAPNQRGRRNDCEGIGRRGRRAQRGRREPAYPASSSDRKLKLFKRLPLDSDTALVSGEVMGMSQERAGVAVEAPGGGCFPPRAPRSSGRGGPWSLQAVGLQSRLRVPSPSAGSRGDTRLSPADTETQVPVGWPRTTALQPGPAPPGAWF